MYLENKGGQLEERESAGFKWTELSEGELTGPGRIGRVTFNRTGKTLYYSGKTFHKAEGFKSNYVCEETAERYWISGPKKRGGDALYPTNIKTKIDEDVRVEYWTEIRKSPERVRETETL
jgi:hypothetical protein